MSHTSGSQHDGDNNDEEHIDVENDQEDIVYLDEDIIQQLDQAQPGEEDDDGFDTINQSDIGEGEEGKYGEGHILAHEHVQNDSITSFSDHKDSVFCVSFLPKEPFDTFVSGDCNDKALIWKLKPEPSEGEESKQGKLKAELFKELPGHTETVEFAKYNHDGKFLVTGGMNNALRVWNVEKDYELKCTLEGPTEDLNFVKWHPKGNVILAGGKDYMVWMFNGQNGDFLSCFTGHEGEIFDAQFTLNDNGKHVLSASADKTLRLWSPMKTNCLQITKDNSQGNSKFHLAEIGCFAIHHERPLVVSGDFEGQVYLSHYQTGEIGGLIGQHADSVESICINRSFPLCASGGIDTIINTYDINTMQLRSKITPSEYGGYTKLAFSSIEPHILYASSTLGDFQVIDVRDGKVVRTYKGHAAPINDFIEVKELEAIVTAGDDQQCFVFDLKQQ